MGLVSELKRRNVIRVAIAYGVAPESAARPLSGEQTLSQAWRANLTITLSRATPYPVTGRSLSEVDYG